MTLLTIATEPALAPPLALALDRVSEAVAIFTTSDSAIGARVVYANDAFCRLSGYTQENLLGHSAMLLAGSRPDAAHVRAAIEAPKDRPFVTVTRKVRPDGSTYDVEMSLVPLVDELGAVTHLMLVQREIEVASRRDHEATEAERVITQRSLAAAQLAAGAAYELERPVAALVNHLHAALRMVDPRDPKDDAGEVVRALESSLEATDHIARTVRALKAFTTGPEAAPAQPIAVHEAIELALQMTHREIAERAMILRSYAPVAPVLAHASKLAHVIVALLRNAAEAIPPTMPFANTVSVATRAGEDGSVIIEVADTGAGIAPNDMPYVFEPFFSTSARPGALGLGLAAARQIVLDLGGTLTVESVQGRGSRFRVTLPPCEGGADGLLRTFFMSEEPPPRRVLAVGETLADARRVAALIADDDAHVVLTTCDDAIERVTLGETFDLIACDGNAALTLKPRLREVSPDLLARLFQLAPRTTTSGIFTAADYLKAAGE